MSAMQTPIRNSLLLLTRTPQSASYQRLLPSAATISPQCQSRRPFSQTPDRRAIMGTSTVSKAKVPAQQGMRSRMQNLTAAAVPDDMGFLPGTFVRPTGDNMPSIFQDPKTRWQIEWLNLKINFQNFIGLLSYYKFVNKKMPMSLRGRKETALDLHKTMYNAFAEGDEEKLRSVTCTGLYEDFVRRISSRSTPTLSWTLHKYYRSPPTFTTAQIVSDRGSPLPGMHGAGVRQVVVRIRSRQSIGKPTAESNSNQVAEAKQRDCLEYLVLQKMMWHGEEKDWKIWGLVDEMTADDLDSPFFAGQGLSVSDRLTMMKEEFSSKR